MSEVELYLIQDGDNCTIYTLQFLRDTENEFEKFISNARNLAPEQIVYEILNYTLHHEIKVKDDLPLIALKVSMHEN